MPEDSSKKASDPKKAEQKRSDGSGSKTAKNGQASKSAAELRQEERDKMIEGMVSLNQCVI